jgi:DNA mismatch endonuclease (patch repair protein)
MGRRGQIRAHQLGGQSTTTVDRVALAFTAPSNLPPAKVYERHHRRAAAMNRSENMRRIRSKDMRPELVMRSLVHKLGYRFRLHQKDLPGKPDLVFVSQRKVILVHGCFWHSHQDCKAAHVPKPNLDYWGPKLQHNRVRDAKNMKELKASGWKVLVIWECKVRHKTGLTGQVTRFLER